MPDFTSLPDWSLWAIFAASAAAVWVAGARLTKQVDRLATITGMGHAFAGMLLLAGLTSLPEIATVGTAAASGNPSLAIANLLGSASINLVLLAMLDPLIGRGALTSFAARPVTLFQGVLSLMILVFAAAGMSTGDVQVFGVGLWTLGLAGFAVIAMRAAALYEKRIVWAAVDAPEAEAEPKEEAEEKGSLARLWLGIALGGAVIFVAGSLLALTGEALAERTGMGDSFTGFILVGFSTSLTEVVAIVTAYRLRRYELAIGDIFGTNIFNTALLLLADVLNPEEPVLNITGAFESFAALLGAAMTGVFLLGLLERRDRTILRMGYDSAIVILLFAGGVMILYALGQAAAAA